MLNKNIGIVTAEEGDEHRLETESNTSNVTFQAGNKRFRAGLKPNGEDGGIQLPQNNLEN